MVLVEILVLQGHVAVIHGNCQLPLTEQPLFCQVIVYLIPRLNQMVRLTISVKIITVRNFSQAQQVRNTLARIPHTLTSEHQTEQTRGISTCPCAQQSVDTSSQAIRIHGK